MFDMPAICNSWRFFFRKSKFLKQKPVNFCEILKSQDENYLNST